MPEERFSIVTNVYRRSSDSAVGYTLQPSFRGYAFGISLSTNRYGYRGPDWSTTRDPEVVRIAIIGDSHAFGIGVEDDATMGQRLTAYLSEATGQRVEALNFALSGYNARQELAVFRSLALRFDPTVLIVVPCNNDADPPLGVDEDGYLRSVATDASREPRSVVTWAGRRVYSTLRQSRLFVLAMMAAMTLDRRGGNVDRSSVSDDPAWMIEPVPDVPVPDALVRLVMDPLRDMISEAKARGMAVILAPLAAPPEYRRLFLDLATEQDVPIVELLGRDVFPGVLGWGQLQQAFGLGWDSHLNAAAHDRWGRLLARTAIERGVVPIGRAAPSSVVVNE